MGNIATHCDMSFVMMLQAPASQLLPLQHMCAEKYHSDSHILANGCSPSLLYLRHGLCVSDFDLLEDPEEDAVTH